jgi:polar amino acid transport system permease protein
VKMSTAIQPTPKRFSVASFRAFQERTGLFTHRLVMIAIAIGLVVWMAQAMRWDWIPKYSLSLIGGIWVTIWMLVVTAVLGFLLAVPIGLVQVTGPRWLKVPAQMFCTIIRGTPLLLQLWLLYYGLGSLFAGWPELRQSWAWPYLRTAWPYGVLAYLAAARYPSRFANAEWRNCNPT